MIISLIASESRALIEPASWRDLKTLHQLEIICFPKDAWTLIDLLGVLTLPNVVRLRAMLDSKMIGFIAADIRPSEQTAWIATIAVMPEFRRQRIGEALIFACEKRLTVPLVRLNVRINNQPAIRETTLIYHSIRTSG